MIRLLAPVLFVLACGKSAPSSSGSSGSAAGSAEAGSATGSQAARPDSVGNTPSPEDTDPCSPKQLGLAGARKLGHKLLRSGCRPKDSAAPQLITTEAQFATQIECADKTTGDAHNWTAGMLVVQTRSPSPAEVGMIGYDDGKAITFVSMQRPPCPNDPQPMPGPNETHVFVAEPPGARTFADRACTVKRDCP